MKLKKKVLTALCLILAIALLPGCALSGEGLSDTGIEGSSDGGYFGDGEYIGSGKYIGIEIKGEDPDFLKAISLSLDRVYSEEKVAGEGSHPAKTLFLEEKGYDPKKTGILYIEDSMALLKDLGYSFNTKGDGMFDISPKKTIKCEVCKEDGASLKIAEAIKADLFSIGIRVKIKKYSSGEYKRLLSGGNYHMIITSSDEASEDSGFIALWEISD